MKVKFKGVGQFLVEEILCQFNIKEVYWMFLFVLSQIYNES